MRPPSRLKEKSTESPHLLAEDENASLAGKADFHYLPIRGDHHGVIIRFGAAVFPAAFRFGNDLLALLNGGFVPFDLQTVFTGGQFGLAELCGLWNNDCLGKGFLKTR